MHAVLRHAAMRYAQTRYWRPLERAADRPERSQARVLAALLAANRDTDFGREYGFADIRRPAEFQQRVPVQEYEALRPLIERQRQTGARALTAEHPVFYSQTSGTTGQPKLIPMTPSMLALSRREQAIFSYLQFRACPAAFAGSALGVMGAAVEGYLDSGHAVGSVSGHLYESLPGSVRSRFVVPPEALRIDDYELKYLVILRLALGRPRITYLGAPNPSTFLRLADILDTERDRLCDSLASGRLAALDCLEPALRRRIAGRLAADPSRADRLRRLPKLTLADVWPDIRLVTTWTGGSCGIPLSSVRRMLPPGTLVMELGYQASEGRGTIALEPETPGGLPPLNHHFYEFAEQARWDAGARECVPLDQLQEGRRYYVLFTTASGLYRYFMNDLVEVTGTFRRTPLLRFVQKGRGVTNLTGEKLYEAQAIQAVQDGAADHGLTPRFFVLVADEEPCGYHLYLEPADANGLPSAEGLARDVDRRLGALNLEYRGKRSSGRLRPLALSWLRSGAGDAYKAAAVSAGQREGQFKPAALQYRRELAGRLDAEVLS
jgi:hypothetical protein